MPAAAVVENLALNSGRLGPYRLERLKAPVAAIVIDHRQSVTVDVSAQRLDESCNTANKMHRYVHVQSRQSIIPK